MSPTAMRRPVIRFAATSRCGANWLASARSGSKQERLRTHGNEPSTPGPGLFCHRTAIPGGRPRREPPCAGGRRARWSATTPSRRTLAPLSPRASSPAGGSRSTSRSRRRTTRIAPLKLTADNLFLTLADPSTEPTPGDGPARPVPRAPPRAKEAPSRPGPRPRRRRGTSTSTPGRSSCTRCRRSSLAPEFFAAVQEQLSVLVGEPAPMAAQAPAVPAATP